MKFIDITRPLGNTTACWPGDTAYRLEPGWEISKGATVNVSKITLSPHNGTHADAPYHYDEHGLRMDQVPVDRFLGPARVIAVSGTSVTRRSLEAADLAGVSKLLIKTGSCPDHTTFYETFPYLEPDAVAYMAEVGVQLVGVDVHSVDPADSKELPAHQACAQADILILENLELSRVSPGEYELIALPLKLVGADASPVRAVLRQA